MLDQPEDLGGSAEEWLPRERQVARIEKQTMFGGLYQMLRITV